MSLIELFVLAVGLSMDAFAVSMCKGLALKKATPGAMIKAGAYFGGFQAGMPLIGYFLGSAFSEQIVAIDHWIAFLLLGYLGVNMIRESMGDDEDDCDDDMGVKTMTVMAIATSIDALAVGVTLAFLHVNIWASVAFIGVMTFTLSAIGVWLGNKLGDNNKINAELMGGIILILIGAKILLEHLGIIG
ncbi:MAG: manganese efflux pump [Clostridia bacterium]|nr:manganese efflux pump [Clostridia bacterium]MBR5285258.1 manganese efflux pump [Clostridia bacterium]